MKNNFTAPLFNYLALSLIFSFLILCEVKGQCPPEVVGPQSSCNPRCDYTITNFNQTQANNYSWSLYNAAGTLIGYSAQIDPSISEQSDPFVSAQTDPLVSDQTDPLLSTFSRSTFLY